MNILALIQEDPEEVVEAVQASAFAVQSSDRTWVIALMLILPALGLINSLIAAARLKSFLNRVPTLATPAHLQALKKEVKTQMILALAQFPLLGLPSLLFMIDLWVLDGPLSDIVYAIGPSIVIFVVSKFIRKVELQVQEMPAATRELDEERIKVVSVWGGQALPDW